MNDPQRTPRQTDPYPTGSPDDDAEILDDSTVLEHLELDLGSAEDRHRIIGICNGLVLGAAVWVVAIFAAVWIF